MCHLWARLHNDDDTAATLYRYTMKRKQPIQPAPQARGPPLCRCGLAAGSQHQCQWRSSNAAVNSNIVDERSVVRSQARPNLHAAQQRRIMVIGSLPSRRRKPRSTLSPIDNLSAQQRQVRLKGMPVDVFHPEPFNSYPIPTIGVVHRMVEHCK